MRRKALAALAALGAIAMAEGTAHAAPNPLLATGDGLDTHLFRPAMDSKGFFATNGSDILGHLDFSVGLIVDYGRNLLRTDGDLSTGRTNSLIDNSFQGTLQANLGLFNQVVVGLDLPIVLMDGAPQYINAGCPGGGNIGDPNCVSGPYNPGVPGWGSAPTTGAPATALNSQNVEFLGLHAKWRILRVEKGFGLALALQAGVAVSDAYRQGAGEKTFFVWPMLIGEKRFGATGKFKLGANFGFRAHDVSTTSLANMRNSISFDKTSGAAGTVTDANLLTYSLAASYRVGEAVDLVLDTYGSYQVGGASTGGLAASNEGTFGIKLFVDRNSYFMLGGGTRYTPGYEAADFRGFVGFIYEPSIGDRDGDGYKDDVDQCPDQPEDFDGFKDQDGCPEPDNDMDGIPDSKDKCPGSDETVKQGKDTKETYNGFEDDDGCPDKGNVIIQGNDILILQKIKFRTNSAEILPESNPILDAVSTTLIHHPEFTLVEVAGHADERAPDDYNLRLTQDRVDSVVAALLSRGLERSRLRSKGYGEYCPANPAHNDAAWEENRRVEFKVVKTRDSGPTGVELGCPNARSHGVNPEPVPP